MENTVTTLFYPKSSEIGKDGRVPIYLRITVNGKRTELSTKRKINPLEWTRSRTSKSLKEVKSYLAVLESNVLQIQQRFENNNEIYTAQDIKLQLTNKQKSRKTILEVFQQHNDKIKSLVGLKKHSYGSYRRFIRTYNHVESYIKKKYDLADLMLNKIDLDFVQNFEHYLIEEQVGNQNTTTKYLTNLNKIIQNAHAKKWIEINPFKFWKATWVKVDREFLSKEEINAIYEKKISIPRLETVRDVFIFSCYTGLAYCDVAGLNYTDIVIGVDGKLWIHTNRLKNNNRCVIPLLSIAHDIYLKYFIFDQPMSKIFPLPSNQKTNAYLKEIATISGITKNLTFHMARHSFATTITLTNGVPIETVSKMLGHNSIKTTQIYARVIDQKISHDMKELECKLNGDLL